MSIHLEDNFTLSTLYDRNGKMGLKKRSPARKLLDLCLELLEFGLAALEYIFAHLLHEPRLHVVIALIFQLHLCTQDPAIMSCVGRV